MTAYLTQADLEARVGAQTVAQYCDDSGSGVADATIVGKLLADASSYADHLLAGFNVVQIAVLVLDPKIINAMSDIAAAFMGRRRREFMRPNGTFPFAELLTQGKEVIHQVASGLERIGAESTTGPSADIGGDVDSGDDPNHEIPNPPYFRDGLGDF